MENLTSLPAEHSLSESPKASLFFSLSLPNLKKYCTDRQYSSTHAISVFRQAYKQFDLDLACTPGLPVALKRDLQRDFVATPLPIVTQLASELDGSVKFVFRLADGSEVESVLMPETQRLTVCLSSQVGCAQACVFCHTGRMGLTRNLSRGEMVAQFWSVQRWILDHPEWLQSNALPLNTKLTNIVFMGMGEPLDNVEETAGALDIFCEPFGLNLTKRRISISTAGHLEGLERLLQLHPDVRLALSIHHPDDRERSRIMPINRRWPLTLVLERLRIHKWSKGVTILVQYTLIGGVNDSIEHAKKLTDLLDGIPTKVNLIPWNPVAGSALVEPTDEQLFAFRDFLHHAGLRVMVRFSKGRDIRAACGQLVTKSSQRLRFNSLQTLEKA